MKYNFYLFIAIVLTTTVACDNDIKEGEFVVGTDFLGINNKVILIDSVTVELSTINLDSLRTSNQNRILLGNYIDPIYGKVKSESYFQLKPKNLDLDNNSSNTQTHNYIFDSISMILKYDRYYYGDTTNVQSISIHRLMQKVKPNGEDNHFYNSSSLTYHNESLGSMSYYPRPKEMDSIIIPLSATFGNELFNKLKFNDLTSMEEFIDYFKGIVITPSSTNSSSIIGFKTSSVVRLYYSKENSTIEDSFLYKDLEINDLTKQFNSISLDRTGTIIENLPPYNSKLPSTLTNNTSFIQSGTGVVCRVDFPHIRELKYISDKGIIVDAELIIKPVRNTYTSLFPIKDSLQVYVCDNLNRISGTLKQKDGTNMLALLNTIPDEFNENLGYKINIGTFLHKEMTKTKGLKSSLLFAYPNITKGVNRIVLGNQNNIDNKLMLKIYYITY